MTFQPSWVAVVALVYLVPLTVQWKSFDFSQGLADFTDMGSYTHSAQKNVVRGVPGSEDNSISTDVCDCSCKELIDNGPLNAPNEIKTMGYLKRIVSSLLHQMNVRGHTFGPQEAITIDLQAEVSYEDFIFLTNFLKSSSDESSIYLTRVDDIFSSLLHLNEYTSTCHVLENFGESFFNAVKAAADVRNLFVAGVTAIFLFVVMVLSWKMVRCRTLGSFLKYSLLLFVIIGLAWEFYGHMEKSRAVNAARLAQTPDIPKECNLDSLQWYESAWYHTKILLGGEDKCVQYFTDNSVDPIWNYSPAAAVAESFGKMSGLAVKAFSNIFPWWIQPFAGIIFMLCVLIGLFGIELRLPFFTLKLATRSEPSPKPFVDLPLPPLLQPEPLPKLEGGDNEQQKQLLEKPANEVVQVKTKDVGVDTSDFEEYLRMRQRHRTEENYQRSRSDSDSGDLPEIEGSDDYTFLSFIPGFSFLARLFSCILNSLSKFLDTVFRRSPSLLVSRPISREDAWN